MNKTQLESVSPDLNDVVEKCPKSGQGIGTGEEGDITELDKHFQIIVKGSFILDKH